MKVIFQSCFFIFTIFFLNACSLSLVHNKEANYKYLNNYQASQLIQIQKQWSKTPYRLGGTALKGADCSGFTQKVFTQNFAISIPRTTSLQMKSGKKVSKNKLRTGDLVFFKTRRGPNGLHVGIYIKDNTFVHLSTRGGAKLANLNEKYWKDKYIGARRYTQ